MCNEFTAVTERDGEWCIAYRLEVPGADGQGRTREASLNSLTAALELILLDRRQQGLKGVPAEAGQVIVSVGVPGQGMAR
ncbi:type II toxin-antitoxin system HicB family antitoxin [bacterium]|nr:type II toxin-antitoxin system HicB family antitoxin [candidate division CSSED10-310 bacterium]